ncbi:unnamed protein product [Urochloa humidicola]
MRRRPARLRHHAPRRPGYSASGGSWEAQVPAGPRHGGRQLQRRPGVQQRPSGGTAVPWRGSERRTTTAELLSPPPDLLAGGLIPPPGTPKQYSAVFPPLPLTRCCRAASAAGHSASTALPMRCWSPTPSTGHFFPKHCQPQALCRTQHRCQVPSSSTSPLIFPKDAPCSLSLLVCCCHSSLCSVCHGGSNLQSPI